jgi:hypothetical protein
VASCSAKAAVVASHELAVTIEITDREATLVATLFAVSDVSIVRLERIGDLGRFRAASRISAVAGEDGDDVGADGRSRG